MICEAIVTHSPNNWNFAMVDVNDMDGVPVKVEFSSLCGTDHNILSGELIYYQNDIAKYPIITGHEWCGTYNGSPVVGICILGCGHCKKCLQGKSAHCNLRREVGVVNKNGAHAEYVVMPEDCLLPIPDVSTKYALTEPLAVCMHALDRVSLDKSMRILISGYGCIGKLCGLTLKLHGYDFEVYDPRYTKVLEFRDFDVILECSGVSLGCYLDIKGTQIVAFGFEYEDIDPSILASNEISIIGTLGSTMDDFYAAVEVLKKSDVEWLEVLPFSDFHKGVRRSQDGYKVVFRH